MSENTVFRVIRFQRANRPIWSDFHDTVTAKIAGGITLLIYFFSKIDVFLYPISYGKYIRFTSYVKLSVCYACPILMFYSSGESKVTYVSSWIDLGSIWSLTQYFNRDSFTYSLWVKGITWSRRILHRYKFGLVSAFINFLVLAL